MMVGACRRYTGPVYSGAVRTRCFYQKLVILILQNMGNLRHFEEQSELKLAAQSMQEGKTGRYDRGDKERIA